MHRAALLTSVSPNLSIVLHLCSLHELCVSEIAFCLEFIAFNVYFINSRETNRRHFVRYEVIGSNSVAVPTHFFKVVLGETKEQTYDLRAFIVPNTAMSDDTPLNKFLVPIDVIERAAGILLFERLPKNRLRSQNAPL